MYVTVEFGHTDMAVLHKSVEEEMEVEAEAVQIELVE